MKISKKRVFDIIQLGTRYDWQSRLFDYTMISMILLNLVILIIDTFDAAVPYRFIYRPVEAITVLFFTIEYALRLWTADYLYPDKKQPVAAIRFLFSFYGIIDLMSVLPYWLPIFLPYGFVTFRILRVFRVFRLFRINAQYDAFNAVVDVLKKRRQQIFSSVIMIVIMMIASSICMYSIEHTVQPKVFKNAFSGIWWAVSTLLTVGYGDIYPITPEGQFVAIIIAFLGVGLVAIPTGIISAGFVEQFAQMRSFSEVSDGNDMRFIMLTLEDDHLWTGKQVSDITLPPELIIVSVYRAGRIIVPRGNTRFRINDKVILGALEFKEDIGIEMHEFEITVNHPWRDQLVKNVSIDRNTVILTVYRHEKPIVPRGNTQFHLGDLVVVCVNNGKQTQSSSSSGGLPSEKTSS